MTAPTLADALPPLPEPAAKGLAWQIYSADQMRAYARAALAAADAAKPQGEAVPVAMWEKHVRKEVARDLEPALSLFATPTPQPVQAVPDHFPDVRKKVAPAVQPSADKVDAERYRWLRARVRGERHLGTGHNQGFAFPSRFDLSPLGDIMRGSVAQHLDVAIDAARARTGDTA